MANSGNDETPASKNKKLYYIIGAVVGAIVLIVLLLFFMGYFGSGSESGKSGPTSSLISTPHGHGNSKVGLMDPNSTMKNIESAFLSH